ncbi:MSMEG_0567/sll0787 family protein [Microbacterium sp. SORGH_AS_0862]|uniref:MSMEG_0567/sll0787 family protein n=1 Tax=Microbacterium sp. SORGH_AS_0862 TaxID=3041789 RepID=UPI0027945252|nr:MSMEG_0567/sll0787 family protein [Microbacterium sp. SORGH_AS_0862]MDQ1206267.1 putative N-acetyltransferase (TIGR04045 family) [Microbacterium sp. SORGH_AS_0862]
MMFDVPVLTGTPRTQEAPAWVIRVADAADLAAYRAIRRDVFVDEQGLFAGTDHDDIDDDPRTVVLVAATATGDVLGGVRFAPATARDIGWWTGGRLVVRRGARHAGGIGSALVREACREAVSRGVLRFDATVQERNEPLFRHLGWVRWGETSIGGTPHVRMRWPIDRIVELVGAMKLPLGDVLAGIRDDHPDALGGDGWVGDDGAPVSGTDVVVATDAILPALIDKDPEWAGWCGVLVNVNDLSAMGARAVGLMDAVSAPTPSAVRRIVSGLRSAAVAWDVPILGGHTQVRGAASLAVTALGRTSAPIPGGGGRAGHRLGLTVDLHGRWRRGFEGRQWDSTSTRTGEELRHLAGLLAAHRPAAAKDVSMAGIVGTTAMLAEASGTGARIDVADIPAPPDVAFGDWLTCFPGYGMLTAEALEIPSPLAHSATIGQLSAEPGVVLRWPDGVETRALDTDATGLGQA